jgi:hypothetical protein
MIDEGLFRQGYGLHDRLPTHPPAPRLHNLILGFAVREHFEDLPDHDPRAGERRFAVANIVVDDDMLS